MEQTDSCQREGVLGSWMKEGEAIKQKNIYVCIYNFIFISTM